MSCTTDQGDEELEAANGACKNFKCSMFKCVPESLSFDMVINGGTCSPCTVRNFMDYLLYVEHAAENLQFYLWYRDYVRRFSLLPQSQKVLSPKWTEKTRYGTKRKMSVAQPTATPNSEPENQQPDYWKSSSNITTTAPDDIPLVAASLDVPYSQQDNESRHHSTIDTPSSAEFDLGTPSLRPSISSLGSAFNDVKDNIYDEPPPTSGSVNFLHPYATQPFRKEVNRIIAIYVSSGSPRELNLTDDERKMVLRALETTTHPTAFKQVVDVVEWTLRQQAHPNFVKWTTGNSNGSRCLMARIVGTVLALIGIAAGIIPIFSSASRAWRAVSLALLLPAFAIMLPAFQGSCIMFLCMHRRHLHPWEFFMDIDDSTLQKIYANHSKVFDAFGTANSYEEEPWVPKYKKRGFLRRVFDPASKVEDPTLRKMQNAVLVRALTVAVVVGVVVVGSLMAVPEQNHF